MIEIRPIKPEELDEFNRLIQISFAAPKEHTIEMPVEWTLCAFEEGRMTTTYGAWPLNMEFNGRVAPIAGVTMVTSLPIHRRKGYLRKITEKHFNLLYEKGKHAISVLYASMTAIYQRYGYGIVSFKNEYKIMPQQLQYASENNVPGVMHETEDNDNKIILDLYHQFCSQRTGYLHRNKQMEVAKNAPFTVLNFPMSPGHLSKIIYMENDKPLGYLIYCVENIIIPGRMAGQRIIIRDIGWLSSSAYNAIWQYLANMDLISEISWSRVPTDDPLPHLLLNPRLLNIMTSDGLLARIVDVQKALPLRGYFEEGTLSFEIIDDVCPWNQGKWEFETSSTGSAVKKTDKNVQLTMPVSTLSMLLFGQISATEAARMGRLDVHDQKALDLWDKVMRTKFRPFCADLF